MLGTVLNTEDRMMYKVKFSDTVELIKRDDIHYTEAKMDTVRLQ